ncbi:MAG TPA: hypothetical protein VHV51_24045 [Polyangiaceae bacterium]|jgi:hypothetical protein|nr:hypothetical protein [Polyangiaceae bacterium]
MKQNIGACLFSCVLLAGCSSSYEPARSPHVATIWEDGHLAYVRDGQHYGSSFFVGNGTIDAVQGNPRAEAEARTGRNLEVGGFVFLLGTVGTAAGALGAIASNPEARDHQTEASVLLASAIAFEITGIALEISAFPHLYDAVNIYNDDLDRAANDEPISSGSRNVALPPAPVAPPGPRNTSFPPRDARPPSHALPPAAPSEALPPPPEAPSNALPAAPRVPTGSFPAPTPPAP